MNAEASNSRELGEKIGRLIGHAAITESIRLSELVVAKNELLSLLKEFEGATIYMSARAQSREDTTINLIESFERDEGGIKTDWLEPDFYRLGSLDVSHPEAPMIFLHREGEPETIRYFAFADASALKVLPPPSET